MGLLRRLLATGDEPVAVNDARMAALAERVTKISPRLRRARQHEKRLAAALARSLAYLDALVASLPAPREASASGWSGDPCVHAFFGAADQVARTMSRSADLRACFDEAPLCDEVCAVLGMSMGERRTLGVALEGEVMRTDVAQTVLSFGDHQVRICAASESALKEEIVSRMVEQITLEAMGRVSADEFRRELLQRERALLDTRLRLLQRRGTGMRAVVSAAPDADPAKLARVQRELEENERELDALGPRTQALDRQLDVVCEMLSEPGPYVHVSRRRMRLSRMNVVQREDAADAGEIIELQLARVPGDPPQDRAFALVSFARRDLVPYKDLLEDASRLI